MSSPKKRIGMIIPSLNTIAEDDFRRFCPKDIQYHVHRIRLRKEDGRVTPESLARAHLEALDEATFLRDMSPDVITFNCTGASVSWGVHGDQQLADRMTQRLGVPSSNTMVAIKRALVKVGAKKIVHVCPFADRFSVDEKASLEASGFEVLKSVGLNFVDAKEAARMEPPELAEIAKVHALREMDAILLSCANVRAFEAVAQLEEVLGLPVITSNQAVLWDTLELLGVNSLIKDGGLLWRD